MIDMRFVLSLEIKQDEATYRHAAMINNWVIGNIFL